MADNKNNRKRSGFVLKTKNKFSNALRGVITAFREESTLFVYFVVTFLAIVFGVWLDLSTEKWALIVFIIGVVVGFEFINTAIENFVDLLSFEYNQRAKKIKDICAAASILNVFTASIAGFLIYIPAFVTKLQGMS
ncbi:diacylglycerol kinase family protein [Spiroplasma endosymbiont of Crioceris asparagi]|uniref:diacylglycerol kinase family protein n=1 Tax=Spiroplasma endosymbiont of Crioceris asparagi TaxID=3066286 RepID=UPI0030CB1844